MASIVKISDFTGLYQVTKNKYTAKSQQEYLNEYERNYLARLLGAELYKLFIADLDGNGVPNTQKYKDIFNSFLVDKDKCLFESDGMKVMLRGFIFFEIARDSDSRVDMSGNVRNTSDNNEGINQTKAGISKAYNEAVKNFCSIQWYINEHIEDYPEYNGQIIEPTLWL